MRGRSDDVRLGIALLVLLAVTTSAMAQPGRDGFRRGAGMFGGRGGFGGPFGFGPLELVRRSDVQQELALTDSQIQEIENVAQAQLEQVRNQFRGLADLPRDQRRSAFAKFQQTRENLAKEAREKVNELLSPSQRSRFAQLEFRSNLQRGRIREALASAGIELDEARQEKLRNTQRQVQADVQQRIAQIQQEANRAILAAIMDADEIKRLMGNEFIFAADQPPERGGPERTFDGGSVRRDGQSDTDAADPDESPDDRSNRRRRRDRE